MASRRKGRVSPQLERHMRTSHRRMLVTGLYLTGQYREVDIAEKLAISVPTVSRDLKHMRELWLEQATTSTDEWCRRELAKLAALEETALEDLKHKGLVREFCDVMLKVMKRRAELLGLDEARRLEITGKEGGPLAAYVSRLTDEELENILLEKEPVQ